MENSYLPWQTPGFKMNHNKRQPLAERSPHESQESPLPTTTAATSNNQTNDSFIWRTRSLDDGRSRMSNNSNSPHEEEHDCNDNTNLHINHLNMHHNNKEEEEELDALRPTPLHSSFDAALLDNDFHSIFRVTKRRASASQATQGSALKSNTSTSSTSNNNNNNNNSNELTPHSSGRKHLRQPRPTYTGNSLFGQEEDEMVCPGTVRKLARHNSNESIKSNHNNNNNNNNKETPVRPRPTNLWTKGGTNSRPPPPASGSVPWKPPRVSQFPLTPTAPHSTATATTHPPTTQEKQCESSTLEDSPSTTPFRFTGFPASLPRVHPPLSHQSHYHGQLNGQHQYGGPYGGPDSVRKRMFAPSSTHHNHTTATHTTIGGPLSSAAAAHHNHNHNSSNNTMNHSREEEGTQNTSISSLSTQGEEDPRMSPVHTRLFLEEEYAYSDDEEEDDDDNRKGNGNGNNKARTSTGSSTRQSLNFNRLLSPKLSLQKEIPVESPFKDLEDSAEKDLLKMPQEETEEATAPTDLSRPYEQRHVHSFPSTMSSHSPLRNLSGYDDTSATDYNVLPKNALHHHHQQSSQSHQHHQPLPQTPEEVQMHFQFDAVGCSPIPGIPEEEELRPRPPPRTGKALSRLPPKPHPTNTTATATTAAKPMTEANVQLQQQQQQQAHSTKSSGSNSGVNQNYNHKDGHNPQDDDSAPLTFSTESVGGSTASTGAKLRRLRPMPDMAAFEMDAGSKSGGHSVDDMSGKVSSPSPKRKPLCPPTPVRTPVWAQQSIGVDDVDADGQGSGERPYLFGQHHRSNSLIMTRVLATCSPQTMEPDYSASKDDESSAAIAGPATAALGAKNASASSDSSNMDQDMDLGNDKNESITRDDTEAAPQHPEAPPPIRRSVGEMGSIVSFETDFEVLGMLGKGAFADVYKVRTKIDNRLYAVKRNRRHFRGKRDREIALAEVRSMQRLQQHSTSQEEQQKTNKSLQYLLFFYRAWQEDGHFFCQTELCCRDTCRELMDCLSLEWGHAKNKYPSLTRHLPAPEGVIAGSSLDVGGRLVPNMTVWKICHDICAGLSHIHSRGIVHNDIKPSNIFFVGHHKLGSICKIGDLGMAAEIGTCEDGQEGDQKYMAPELLSSPVKNASSDIFSLGLTLYEMAAGFGFDLPKQGPRWHELRNGSHFPDLPSSRDPALGSLVQQMMLPSHEQRPCSDAILKLEKVALAGNSCDEFLRDYITDIEDYDKRISLRRGSYGAENAAEDQTPRAGTGVNGIACRARVCSPTLGPFSTAAANIFTPEAQST